MALYCKECIRRKVKLARQQARERKKQRKLMREQRTPATPLPVYTPLAQPDRLEPSGRSHPARAARRRLAHLPGTFASDAPAQRHSRRRALPVAALGPQHRNQSRRRPALLPHARRESGQAIATIAVSTRTGQQKHTDTTRDLKELKAWTTHT